MTRDASQPQIALGLERALTVFASLWAVALMFEYAAAVQRSGTLALVSAIVAARVVALWVVWRPSAVHRLLLLCGVQVAIILVRLPKGPNHGILVLAAATTILLAAARVMLANRNWRISPAALFSAAAPALRWELVAMYFWALFQKLNNDYFVVDLSCGPAQVWNLHRVLTFFPNTEALATFGVHGTLLVEAGIPLLLLLRRTRYFGVALAIGFHFTLGANYTGFSAMLFAMLSLFLPAEFFTALWKFVGRVPLSPSSLRAKVGAVVDRGLTIAAMGLVALTCTIAVFAPDAKTGPTGAPWVSPDLLLTLWFLYGGSVIALFGLCAWAARPWIRSQRPRFALPYWSLAIMPLLVFGNGLAPHLGLKNTQVFAMFSNLHVRGGQTNHLFIPGSWQRWDHLSDLVTILESSDPVLAKLVDPSWKTFNYFSTYVVDRPKMERTQRAPSWRLPYLALRRRITDLADAGHRNVRLVYERGGEVIELDRAETEPRLSNLPWWYRKLFMMRAIPDTNRGYCMW